MQLEDIKKLAVMARINMDDAEMEEIGGSFDSILSYIGQIEEVSETLDTNYEEAPDEPINIFREDVATNMTGKYTDKMLEQMPDQEAEFLKVKQIL